MDANVIWLEVAVYYSSFMIDKEESGGHLPHELEDVFVPLWRYFYISSEVMGHVFDVLLESPQVVVLCDVEIMAL